MSVGTLPGGTFMFRFEYAKTRVRKGGDGWCPVRDDSGDVVGWSWETNKELVVVDTHGALVLRVLAVNAAAAFGNPQYPVLGPHGELVGFGGFFDGLSLVTTTAPFLERVAKFPRPMLSLQGSEVRLIPSNQPVARIQHKARLGTGAADWSLELVDETIDGPLRTVVLASPFVYAYGRKVEE